MKTLYIRIVVTFIVVALVSGVVALFMTNAYYLAKIKDFNEQKTANIAGEIKALYEHASGLELADYLSRIAAMGFRIYAVNSRMEGSYYGAPFKDTRIGPEAVRRVLEGETYRGILEKRHVLMVAEYFENSVRNSVGLPLEANGERYALFIRPNLEQQIGDVRLILGSLLGLTFVLSLILIVILTRYIVRPVKKLTEATTKIVGGDYYIELDVARQDEIGNLARHFTHMAQSLKQLDEMRQEFVANVSHEIQSPLTSIQGFAQTILDKRASPEEEERYIRIIAEESGRLSSLGKQLLTLASLDKETSALKRADFRLDEQLRQVLIVSERQWAEKQLSLEPELPELVVNGDPQLLYQVWQNVIANSIKFSKPGGTIRVEAWAERDTVVRISDTGVGIPASELPHIFERFYKADKSRNRTRSGSGLGLAIVRKIIELHDGTIEAQSETGKGTTMTIRLPRL